MSHMIPEGAGFLSAPGTLIHRIKIDQDMMLTNKLGYLEKLAVLVFKFKMRY